MMAALGAGAVAQGRLVVSLGTSGTLFGYSPVPLLDPTGAIAPFCDCTGAFLPLVCTQNCTGCGERNSAHRSNPLNTTHCADTEFAPRACSCGRASPRPGAATTPDCPAAAGVPLLPAQAA